ncbi:MAG: DUF3868 domain-containing protein [Dysgonamonadaceae bacterium]|jgi:hypothetical protein|nr:DUF3868 domain-containing protein [Dysgonamonadaceae bacterium]
MKNNHIFRSPAIAFLLLLVISPTVFSQNSLQNGIQVQNMRKRYAKKELEVHFDIVLRGIEVSSDNQLVLSPIVQTPAGKTVPLPEIIINGKRKHDLYKRSQKLQGKQIRPAVYDVSIAPGGALYRTIPYEVTLELTEEMADADLYIVSDLCGCGGSKKDFFKRLIEKPFIEQDQMDYIPLVSFLIPPKEEVKERSAIGEAYLSFEQGKWNIVPDLYDNPQELKKIKTSLDFIREEPTAVITGMTIKAYASPEGNFDDNLVLSKSRARALLEYVQKQSSLYSVNVFSEGYGEDWDRLTELIKADYTMPDKEQVLNIIRTVGVFDGREKQLMDLAGGRSYRYMLKNLFPLLRRSYYRIEYTVPEFATDKAASLVKTKPEMLSLQEMYGAASMYEKGSKAYSDIFETAQRLHPEDKTAQLNIAAVALLNGDRTRAKEILEKYENDPAAWNNLGIVYMKEKQWDKAEYYLQKAMNYGTPEAVHNLKKLREIKH